MRFLVITAIVFCFEHNRIRCRLLEEKEKENKNEPKQSIHPSIQSIINLINKLTASYLVLRFFLSPSSVRSFVLPSLYVFAVSGTVREGKPREEIERVWEETTQS